MHFPNTYYTPHVLLVNSPVPPSCKCVDCPSRYTDGGRLNERTMDAWSPFLMPVEHHNSLIHYGQSVSRTPVCARKDVKKRTDGEQGARIRPSVRPPARRPSATMYRPEIRQEEEEERSSDSKQALPLSLARSLRRRHTCLKLTAARRRRRRRQRAQLATLPPPSFQS